MEYCADTELIKPKQKRVWELDFLRGLAVILMLWDHFMCDFVYLPWWFSNYKLIDNAFIKSMVSFANLYWDSALRFWGHYTFVFVFLFLVGTSCSFSRDNTKRGAMLAVVALVFTGGSFILKMMGVLEDGIVFGILDCIALSILCASAVDNATIMVPELFGAERHSRIVKATNTAVPFILGVIIIAFGIKAEFWNIRFDNSFHSEHLIDYIMGTKAFGDDWFGLFPNVGAVLLGLYFGKVAYSTRTSLLPRLDGKWNKPFRFVGRHALIFYILHQALLSGLVAVVCLCLGYRF